ncbi:MAG TPA: helix-turn-helix transcriptional regulator [Thermoanaerobaculia bacterium]|nr:helix-turn-helix transcriptional regulator [Thermoanaerobaculia bacterium]
MPDPSSPRAPLLGPTELLVLLALAEGDRHGYGIRKDVLELTDGAVELDAGNLYRSMRRLLERGLVERLPAGTDPDADPRRRDYRLTAPGREAVGGELMRLDRLLGLTVARRLRTRTST